MPKRSSNSDEPQTENALIEEMVDALTINEDEPEPPPEKNPAAVALGRLGGLKGGKARADKLSAKKRSEIAKKAAEARWRKPQE